MKKILFVATVPEHFCYFHLPCFKLLRENGWEVHAACANAGSLPEQACDKVFDVPLARSPIDPKNRQAYRQLKKIIDENEYDLIHCHTPMGGAVARLASREARKRGTRVFYTAHGFHFYKGAPAAGWLLYFPAERLLSRMTDELITINNEDFQNARKLMRAGNVEYIHGVGYNTSDFFPATAREKAELREEYSYRSHDRLLIYVAEQNRNKNQGMLIKALEELISEGTLARLLIVGPDNANGEYVRMAQEKNLPVDFLGVRDDVPRLMKMCDVYVASSLREGLPVNVMEAMATGLPVVAADNRGHKSLVEDGITGFIVPPNDAKAMSEKIGLLLGDSQLCSEMGDAAQRKIVPYGRENVLQELSKLYNISSTELIH